jgi:predicted RecA/RadA family phage recombinase
VPANVTHEGVEMLLRSGTFTIKADGTCSTKTVFVLPSRTESAREVGATYTNEGSKLTMQWKGAGKTVGTIQGNTFTMDNEGMVFVYKK